MEPPIARVLWQYLETLNAVAYFSPECAERPAQLGLKGFWMGYFACRAAPLGAVGPAVVEATFYNFHPDRVRRAIPDAWAIAEPSDIIAVRADAGAAALRRLLPGGGAERLAGDILAMLREVVEAAGTSGHPLFAANRDVASHEDPVGALWQAATTLREHRGDVHVNLLAGAGLDGCEVLVLFAGTEDLPAELFQQSRGWSPDDWSAAAERLAARGLVGEGNRPTPSGRSLRTKIEQRTDELALEPYRVLGEGRIATLVTLLRPAAEQIAAAGEIRFPNPMGLPRP